MVVQYKPKPTIFNNFLKGYLFKKNPLHAVLACAESINGFD